MVLNNYILVNPYIKGKVETNIKSKNSLEAANIIYNNLSEHFNNAVPKFYFTIQKGGSDKFYHFKVSEKKRNNEINFNINQVQVDNDTYINNDFKKKLEKIQNKMNSQEGGDKKKKKKSKSKSKKKKHVKSSESESESDTSSENVYIKTKKYYYSEPLYYWWYDPLVYNLDSVFLPTFYSYVTPYVQLDTTVVSVPAY